MQRPEDQSGDSAAADDAEAVSHASDTANGVGNAHIPRFRHMFDPWLSSSHKAVIAVTENLIFNWEELEPPRQRRLREVDRQNRDAIIRAVAANLAFAVAMGFDPPAIGISLRAGKQAKTRYDRDGFTGLPRVVGLLGERSGNLMLDLQKSAQRGTASGITASPAFREMLERFKFRPEHFAQLPGREPLWLSRTARDFAGNVEGRELINYSDTTETMQLRAEVARINAALEAADLTAEPDGGPPLPTGLRSVRRVFNLPPDAPEDTVRFDLGGRLFGGWWQTVPKTRRAAIRIKGQTIADLDFANMALRLAYAEVGVQPPEGDLYAGIPGLSEDRWRPGVKKVVSAMMFRRSPLSRVPRGTRGMLPAGVSAAELRASIIAAHPALAGVFETGIGLRLMFVESQILVSGLLALADAGVAALPMHDGLMVPRSAADKAARIMGDASESVTGYRLPISLNLLYA